MGVDALVRYHTFTLGHSAYPLLIPLGDVFHVGDKTLAAKQPGQFVFGAIPYFALRMLGITYETNYDLAAALVTWLSAGLFAALALVLLDRMMWRFWGFSRTASLVAALAVGVASNWLCYAGIAHHDALAASLIVFALYAVELNRYRDNAQNKRLMLLAGGLLGLTVFTSMLPALIVLVLAVSVAWTRSLRSILWHGMGFAAGILPLLIYNTWYFRRPFVPANVAGNYSDTFFSFRTEQFLQHLNAYLGGGGLSLWKYAPGLALGLAGLALLPPHLRRLRNLLAAAVAVHLFYLVNIETLGTCEYGPRYLLPVLPLLAPGVAALIDWRGMKTANTAKLLLAGALLAYGFLVNLVGAIQGTMYCNLEEFALWQQIAGINHLPPGHCPLFKYALLMAAAAIVAWGSHYLILRPGAAAPAVPVKGLTAKVVGRKR